MEQKENVQHQEEKLGEGGEGLLFYMSIQPALQNYSGWGKPAPSPLTSQNYLQIEMLPPQPFDHQLGVKTTS